MNDFPQAIRNDREEMTICVRCDPQFVTLKCRIEGLVYAGAQAQRLAERVSAFLEGYGFKTNKPKEATAEGGSSEYSTYVFVELPYRKGTDPSNFLETLGMRQDEGEDVSDEEREMLEMLAYADNDFFEGR